MLLTYFSLKLFLSAFVSGAEKEGTEEVNDTAREGERERERKENHLCYYSLCNFKMSAKEKT